MALSEFGMDLPDLALQITGSVTMEQWLPPEDIIGALMNPGVTMRWASRWRPREWKPRGAI